MRYYKIIVSLIVFLLTVPNLYGQQAALGIFNGDLKINSGYVLSTASFEGNTQEALDSPHFLAGYKKGWQIGASYKVYQFSGFDTFVGLQYARLGFIQKRCHMENWNDVCHGPGYYRNYMFEGTTQLNYLSIPLTIHRDFEFFGLRPFARGGISIDYLIKPEVTNIYDLSYQRTNPGDDKGEVQYRSDIARDLDRLSPSVNIAVGLNLNSLLGLPVSVKGSYSQNITNIYNGSSNFELRNKTFQFGIELNL